MLAFKLCRSHFFFVLLCTFLFVQVSDAKGGRGGRSGRRQRRMHADKNVDPPAAAAETTISEEEKEQLKGIEQFLITMIANYQQMMLKPEFSPEQAQELWNTKKEEAWTSIAGTIFPTDQTSETPTPGKVTHEAYFKSAFLQNLDNYKQDYLRLGEQYKRSFSRLNSKTATKLRMVQKQVQSYEKQIQDGVEPSKYVSPDEVKAYKDQYKSLMGHQMHMGRQERQKEWEQRRSERKNHRFSQRVNKYLPQTA